MTDNVEHWDRMAARAIIADGISPAAQDRCRVDPAACLPAERYAAEVLAHNTAMLWTIRTIASLDEPAGS